ncbi:hypothetical protein M427DRAFT_39680 [Gonapodya prolifera JEL478]|uniref:RING-14 protein n=1 Tax=Gonapodya prolifera (strain JEL478) TaxID=1344416 RepID=A0A138ZWZ1_GONPJ|nr:hypothetical protein M427DRAFT_39680 [Gonapodya prolifera JEL478]|eukprot:KXS09016.1 hypothetical protein M427DRAFT_39680 [Gonapodya prolifera JEL478]
MKFAKELEREVEGLPIEWRTHAVDYKKLKKSIKLVQRAVEEQLAELPEDAEVVYTLTTLEPDHAIQAFLAVRNTTDAESSIDLSALARLTLAESAETDSNHTSTPFDKSGPNIVLSSSAPAQSSFPSGSDVTRTLSVPVSRPRRATIDATSATFSEGEMFRRLSSQASFGSVARRRSIDSMDSVAVSKTSTEAASTFEATSLDATNPILPHVPATLSLPGDSSFLTNLAKTVQEISAFEAALQQRYGEHIDKMAKAMIAVSDRSRGSSIHMAVGNVEEQLRRLNEELHKIPSTGEDQLLHGTASTEPHAALSRKRFAGFLHFGGHDHNHKELYTWRALLALYLSISPFLEPSTLRERPLDVVSEGLVEFEQKASHIAQDFSANASRLLLDAFLRLNWECVRVRKFEFLNSRAITKILKKHDKRTNLHASDPFHSLLSTHPFFTTTPFRRLVSAIADNLVTVIPQPDDYSCPVCSEILWRPVKLRCGHSFCHTCVIKSEVTGGRRDCPICRAPDALHDAGLQNIDQAQVEVMKKWFPEEVAARQQELDIEAGRIEAENMMLVMGFDVRQRNARRPRACSIM